MNEANIQYKKFNVTAKFYKAAKKKKKKQKQKEEEEKKREDNLINFLPRA
jgi:hypothetical protein